MIDLKLLRKEPEKVTQKILRKDPTYAVDLLIALDAEVRGLKLQVEDLRGHINLLAKQAKQGVTEEQRAQSRQTRVLLKLKEEQLKTMESQFHDHYARCPNLVAENVPEGTAENNVIVTRVGEAPQFDFEPRNHVDLGAQNGWFDFERAAHMTGAHFALYKQQGVSCVYALLHFMLNNAMRHGYEAILPPYVVNETTLFSAGNLPGFKDALYVLQDDQLYLTPTAEANLTSFVSNRIFGQDELPLRLTSWTSCFRKEAGGYGAQERGLIRMHQFEKVELYTVCMPSNAKEEQERMIACAEKILQDLHLHYRISLLAGQDCSFASAKTYDIEVWMPGQKAYKEVSSVSNCTDFQARRAAIRYREAPGKATQFAYTLNGTALALPRLMVAVMETYQQADGSIALPDILKQVTIAL